MQELKETTEINARIAELKQRYTRLALQCRSAGIRVNSVTIKEYARELERLKAELN